MTVQEDVAAVRKLGVSRKNLATLSGLTEGKIWRIEAKGNASSAEEDALKPHLTEILSSGRAPTPTSTSRPTPPTTQTSTQTSKPASAVVATEPEIELAREVLTSQVEVEAGPDRSLGFRLVSNSELQTFKDCRRRWWLAWYLRLRPIESSPVGAREIGNRIHRALRYWYVAPGQRRVDPRHALEVLITQDWTTVCEVRGGESNVDTHLRRQFTDEANLERIMLEGYVQHLAETGVDAELTVIAPETYLEADVTKLIQVTGTEPPTKLIGKIDVRVQRTYDGVRQFLDHKTVQGISQASATLPLDEQMLHYHLLEWFNTDSAEERCDGALYNMLRKVKRTPAAKPPFYVRVEVQHNPHEIESFKQRVLATTRDMYALETEIKMGADPRVVAYPRPSRDCEWKCDFVRVCSMFNDGSRADAMLERYYREEDPLSHYVDGKIVATKTEGVV